MYRTDRQHAADSSIFTGRTVRRFQSAQNVFEIVSEWSRIRKYELVEQSETHLLYRKVKGFQRLVLCYWQSGLWGVEAWLSPRSKPNGFAALPSEMRLEYSSIGAGDARKQQMRKEVDSLFRSLGLEKIGKIKGFSLH